MAVDIKLRRSGKTTGRGGKNPYYIPNSIFSAEGTTDSR